MVIVKRSILVTTIMIMILLFGSNGFAQLSPGELAEAHAHLEGMSNCTECHTLGQKVSNDKCLACHTQLKERIDQQKGYHSSNEISGKECIVCHSDHHGRGFDLIRFDKEKFDHNLTGYELFGAHKKKDCKECHKKDFISNDEVKKKSYTFLGLNTDCLSCHDDYHRSTMSSDCKKCHDFNLFKPAPNFNHNNAKFRLIGKHTDVDCRKCHKITIDNGQKFQEFTGIQFKSCTSCHKDVHNNKFGQNCTKCHNEQSFHVILGMSGFDHSRTNFKLEAKHSSVDCKECHKAKLTDPVKHERCADCHKDYHEGQFVKPDQNPDCSDCHSINGFAGSSFTIERHTNTEFPLLGAHLATPCFVCHKKEEKWNFRNIGTHCNDCHDDFHNSFIESKYYPEKECKACHTENRWSEVNFDHLKTGYELLGAHKDQSCRACHFKSTSNGQFKQQFASLNSNCTECHNDKHYSQFDKDGTTDCFFCHNFNNWKADKFNHNNTRFILDGKHKNLACSECHKNKKIGANTFVQYKLNTLKCEDCH